MSYDLEEEGKPVLSSSFLQLLEYSCDTAWVSGLVVSLDVSGCSALDTFYLVNFLLYMGVPHGAVLQ